MLVVAWCLAVGGSLAVNLAHHAEQARSLTEHTANALLEKDMLYREWSILHGGVYVPKTEAAPPLASPPDEEREITTPSGQRLTLLNPAVVSRQIFEIQERDFGIHGRLTSLDPIVPSNLPDAWERQALLRFERGDTKATTVETRDGERYFRLMHPLVMEPACIVCHEERGRPVGKVRGAISLRVPMSRFLTKGENERLVLAHAGLWLMGMAGIVLGVRNLEAHSRKRLRAEEALREQYELTQNTLRDKQALLQEIHHRVKNNLQVISSLLQLQINSLNDPQATAILRESQLRVRSMALIHEKLYQSASLAQIDLQQYLKELAHLLLGAYERRATPIALELDLAPATVSIDTAIPLGLIMNELVTNSLKFAFPGGRSGAVRVELKPEPDGEFLLRVSDNGTGFPPDFAPERCSSLGLRLVMMLTGQLEAQGTWEQPAAGTSFALRFRDRLSERKEGSAAATGGRTPAETSSLPDPFTGKE